jgi:hypothetical protein
MRSAFVARALMVTVAVGAFIDLLASERSAVDAHAARPTSVIAAHG